MHILIVGGGVLGTSHALQAVERGHTVTHFEREPEGRGATVRNFGLVWVSGRSSVELPAALRSRELWEQIAAKVPGIGFRANGSLTLVRTPAELAVAEAAVARPDAGTRGFELLDPEQVRAVNPALGGKYLAGLRCSRDAAVESRVALPAIRQYLAATGRYHFFAGVDVRSVASHSGGATVTDHDGGTHTGDLAIVCPGATHAGLLRDIVGELPVRRVRLQMMQTAPLGESLTTSIADADSFRYYPGFAGPELDELRRAQPQNPVAAQHHMQLLCVQRLHGGLTIGDTHSYDEPFGFDVDEAPYDYLRGVVEELLGRELPPIVRRWAGVYSQSLDPDLLATRSRADDHIWVVTGPGGRGMTLAPHLGEETADLLNL